MSTSLATFDNANDLENEFLSFVLGNENYGLDIMKVKEIRAYENVTSIANTPEFFKGVLNLRGDVVPIIDLRIKFGLGEPTYDEFTIVIMLSIANKTVGIVVDAVSDVIRLANDEMQPPPECGAAFDIKFIQGLAPIEDVMLIIINIEKLLTSDDLGLFESTSTTDLEQE